eukprot:g4550.t1
MSTYRAPRNSILYPGIDTFSEANTNVVYVPYCTSDAYIGNRKIDENVMEVGNRKIDENGMEVGNRKIDENVMEATSAWYFSGREVVRSVFAQLIERHGLGSSRDHIVIYSGCSAGGRGVMHNLNFVQDQLAALDANIKLVGLIDSGEYIDVPLYPKNKNRRYKQSFAEQARGVLRYTNASIHSACSDVYAGNDSFKCLLGEYAFSTLRSPFLAHSFQFDAYQAMVDLGIGVNPSVIESDDDMRSYEGNFRNRTRAVLLDLAAERAPSAFGYHSSACFHHCNTESATFATSYRVGNVSLRDALESFVLLQRRDDTPPFSSRVMEDCDGVACGVCAGS